MDETPVLLNRSLGYLKVVFVSGDTQFAINLEHTNSY